MLRLRKAMASDCALLFAWANDCDTRRNSLCSDPIAWEPHCAWFQSKISDLDCYFFIAYDAAELPVGQIRFDVCGARATVSVSLDAAQRGRGYGVLLITQGVPLFCSQVRLQEQQDCLQEQRNRAQVKLQTCSQTPVHVIDAWIKPGNTASQRAFERAGFRDLGLERLNECPYKLPLCHFVFACPP